MGGPQCLNAQNTDLCDQRPMCFSGSGFRICVLSSLAGLGAHREQGLCLVHLSLPGAWHRAGAQ